MGNHSLYHHFRHTLFSFGKLAATAGRTDKPHDGTDLIWLMQAAGSEISEARALYQPPFVLAATRRIPELAAHFAELQIPIDTAAKVLDCSLEAQALRQMTTGWIQAAPRHLCGILSIKRGAQKCWSGASICAVVQPSAADGGLRLNCDC